MLEELAYFMWPESGPFKLLIKIGYITIPTPLLNYFPSSTPPLSGISRFYILTVKPDGSHLFAHNAEFHINTPNVSSKENWWLFSEKLLEIWTEEHITQNPT